MKATRYTGLNAIYIESFVPFKVLLTREDKYFFIVFLSTQFFRLLNIR